MKKNSHIFWVCPSSDSFFRLKGEVRCRPSSVLPKLVEKGFRLTVLIPFNPVLLPKSKVTSTRVIKQSIHLSQDFPVEITKLTRAQVFPQIYMVKVNSPDPAIQSAVFSKAAIELAKQINKPVDVFHLFGWKTALLPLFLEMEKTQAHSKVFEKSKTFLNIESLKELGSFSPDILNFLGISKTLFHPDGIEYYGQVSFLKTGLLFSDEVGLVETTVKKPATSVNGLGGFLNSISPKLRRWASSRSLRSHLEAYKELLAAPLSQPLLPTLVKKIKSLEKPQQKPSTDWGPIPPDRYHTDMLGFLIQSPLKGYCFWEWTKERHQNLGLLLEDLTTHRRIMLSDQVWRLGEFWLDLEPNHYYAIELLGRTASGTFETLLRSRVIRTPRNKPSDNRKAVFLDTKTKQRFSRHDLLSIEDLLELQRQGLGGSFEMGYSINVSSSWKQKVLV